MRRVLRPMEDVAEKTGCAIVIIAHLNKKEDAATLYRVGGSIGFVGAARSVLAVSKGQREDDPRVLYSLKSNLSKRPPALAYEIQEKADTSHIVWCGPSSFDPQRQGAGDEPRMKKECLDFLKQELADGEVESAQITQHAKDAGISWRTLKLYKSTLGVTARWNNKRKQWFWVPPEEWEQL